VSRPIPRKLLVDTVEYFKVSGTNAYGKDTFETAVTITHVRVDSIKKNILNSLGDAQNDKATLFYDAKNSSPVVSFSKQDKIVFDGLDYTIREIDILKGDSVNVHHLEIALV